MKIFQSLLMAPAALGLLCPISATATELNIKDASIYSQVESIPTFDQIYPTDWAYEAISDIAKSRGCLGSIPEGNLTRLEAATILNKCLTNAAKLTEQETRIITELNSELARVRANSDSLDFYENEFDAGTFSATTSASFSSDMAIGSVDQAANQDKLQTAYGFSIALTTSFTGEDSLDVALSGGNGHGALTEFDLSGMTDANDLGVDGISYTFPLGDKTTAMFGFDVDGSSLYNTACLYGGPSDSLDNCGNWMSAMATDSSTALGLTYDFGNGLTASFGYEGDGTTGLATEEGLDAYGGQLSYLSDKYGISLTYAKIEPNTTSSDSYTAINGYFDPGLEGVPSISAGYEIGDDDSETGDASELSAYFIGLQWDEFGSGTLGVALGSQGHYSENADEELMYEAYYSYAFNDGMTITPLIYIKDKSAANVDDETGLLVKTSFSF
mgnify:CR=1 FL=1